MKAWPRIMAIVATLVALLVGSVVLATGASASASGHVLEGAVARKCPSIICAYVFTVTNPGGASLPFDCWIDSPNWPYGRWFKVTGMTAYIRTADVDIQPKLPDHC